MLSADVPEFVPKALRAKEQQAATEVKEETSNKEDSRNDSQTAAEGSSLSTNNEINDACSEPYLNSKALADAKHCSEEVPSKAPDESKAEECAAVVDSAKNDAENSEESVAHQNAVTTEKTGEAVGNAFPASILSATSAEFIPASEYNHGTFLGYISPAESPGPHLPYIGANSSHGSPYVYPLNKGMYYEQGNYGYYCDTSWSPDLDYSGYYNPMGMNPGHFSGGGEFYVPDGGGFVYEGGEAAGYPAGAGLMVDPYFDPNLMQGEYKGDYGASLLGMHGAGGGGGSASVGWSGSSGYNYKKYNNKNKNRRPPDHGGGRGGGSVGGGSGRGMGRQPSTEMRICGQTGELTVGKRRPSNTQNKSANSPLREKVQASSIISNAENWPTLNLGRNDKNSPPSSSAATPDADKQLSNNKEQVDTKPVESDAKPTNSSISFSSIAKKNNNHDVTLTPHAASDTSSAVKKSLVHSFSAKSKRHDSKPVKNLELANKAQTEITNSCHSTPQATAAKASRNGSVPSNSIEQSKSTGDRQDDDAKAVAVVDCKACPQNDKSDSKDSSNFVEKQPTLSKSAKKKAKKKHKKQMALENLPESQTSAMKQDKIEPNNTSVEADSENNITTSVVFSASQEPKNENESKVEGSSTTKTDPPRRRKKQSGSLVHLKNTSTNIQVINDSAVNSKESEPEKAPVTIPSPDSCTKATNDTLGQTITTATAAAATTGAPVESEWITVVKRNKSKKAPLPSKNVHESNGSLKKLNSQYKGKSFKENSNAPRSSNGSFSNKVKDKEQNLNSEKPIEKQFEEKAFLVDREQTATSESSHRRSVLKTENERQSLVSAETSSNAEVERNTVAKLKDPNDPAMLEIKRNRALKKEKMKREKKLSKEANTLQKRAMARKDTKLSIMPHDSSETPNCPSLAPPPKNAFIINTEDYPTLGARWFPRSPDSNLKNDEQELKKLNGISQNVNYHLGEQREVQMVAAATTLTSNHTVTKTVLVLKAPNTEKLSENKGKCQNEVKNTNSAGEGCSIKQKVFSYSSAAASAPVMHVTVAADVPENDVAPTQPAADRKMKKKKPALLAPRSNNIKTTDKILLDFDMLIKVQKKPAKHQSGISRHASTSAFARRPAAPKPRVLSTPAGCKQREKGVHKKKLTPIQKFRKLSAEHLEQVLKMVTDAQRMRDATESSYINNIEGFRENGDASLAPAAGPATDAAADHAVSAADAPTASSSSPLSTIDEETVQGTVSDVAKKKKRRTKKPQEALETGDTNDLSPVFKSTLTLEDRIEMNADLQRKIHMQQLRAVVPTKLFQCNQVTRALDIHMKSFLEDLVRFQQRQFMLEPIKAKSKRRYMCGIKETEKRLHKVKLLLIAPDIERKIPLIMKQLQDLLEHAEECNVPVVFGLSRRKMAKICKLPIGKKISCIGIINYEGAEEKHKEIMELVPELRREWEHRNLPTVGLRDLSSSFSSVSSSSSCSPLAAASSSDCSPCDGSRNSGMSSSALSNGKLSVNNIDSNATNAKTSISVGGNDDSTSRCNGSLGTTETRVVSLQGKNGIKKTSASNDHCRATSAAQLNQKLINILKDKSKQESS
uniref:Serine/arginine repetitive matrix protein 2-like n=1 Tax=Hirondellea gigas TaxID=1518452 RepID=A0A2P2I2M2_9CRUS